LEEEVMVSRWDARSVRRLMFAAFAALAVALPAFAQGGMARGVVKDDGGKPVDGATIVIETTGSSAARRYEIKTNAKGEYFQIGLTSGGYTVTASKDALKSQPTTITVRLGQTATADFVLGLNAAAAAAVQQGKMAELKRLFEEGVAAGAAGRHDEAIEKFKQGLAIGPDCFDCYNRIGSLHVQKKEYDLAEAAYKKSTEIKPDNPMAYSGLATVYNNTGKADLATQASAKAIEMLGAAGGAGGGAEAAYNQGVILWNQGKIADAKAAFERAVQTDPNHAGAHYQLGMVLVNDGNLAGAAAEFETYLKLAPDGPQAPTAKALLAQLKP
jgi:tetratricopeptide (TPR) repeat protein